MKNTERYRHLRVDWVGQSITLCAVEGEDIGAGQALCPDCAQVGEALNVCGLGPESLRELFDTLRVFGPFVKGGVNLDHFGGAKVDQLVKG